MDSVILTPVSGEDIAQIQVGQAMVGYGSCGVQQLRRHMAVVAACAGLVAILLVFGVYGLFRGYFDSGSFEVKQIQWSPANKVAILVERSDNQALGGLTYFVIVDNHVLSPAELKLAYHSNAVIFDAMATCLNLHWENPNRLVVTCNGSSVHQEYINVEKRQMGEMAISYVNISPDTARTFRPK